ncbi:MAG: dockerin type I domain-containing protein, partial [Coriobacteriales bacterium]|nr:dockerin type I domain-containing protein [Coriobacteriales bacterium]
PGPAVGLPASGDLDGDGHATASEALQVARAVISGTSGWSDAQIAAADMDGDGYLTMADVVRSLRKAAGLT